MYVPINVSGINSEKRLSLGSSSFRIDFGKPINLTCMDEAWGDPPLAYEWYKDDMIIPGESDPYLYIPEALPDKRGNYFCKVTNSDGVIESSSTEVIIPGILYICFTKYLFIFSEFLSRHCSIHSFHGM